MYAGTKFNWYDQSYFSESADVAELNERPVFLTAFSADKGTEKMIRIYGDDFYKMYGTKPTLSFAKHGQALIQASKIIDAGGELLCKRVVASDATLSNVILVANITKVETQKTNANGELLYVDATSGEETIVAEGNLPLNLTSATIKWEAKTIANCKTNSEVVTAAEALLDEETGVYPMYIITDIGRNADIKKVKILPDYQTSKSLGFMVYNISEIENTTTNESVIMTSNPKLLFQEKSYAVNNYLMGQLTTSIIDGVYEKYADKLAELSGIDVNTLKYSDLLFGCDCKGISLPGITINAEGVDLSAEYGVPLNSGSDGTTFGTVPCKSEEYTTSLVAFFNGDFTDEIFDIDIHKIYACVDANYPKAVKEAIATLANFREDFVFFRDLGLGLTTFDLISTTAAGLTKSKFIADYLTTYMIEDPATKKRVEVTMMYDFAPLLVQHFVSGVATPLAGEVNNFILTSAISGTINYTPRNTKSVNQKDLLDEARINYATYYEYEGNLIVESLYTSQDLLSQLSYVNNVLAIQEVMRAIRTNCPKNRFKFQTGNDFSDYADSVKLILSNFKQYFNSLDFTYTSDDIKATQKIFYASIKFSFNNWVQSEIFDLFAVDTSNVTEE